MITRKTWFGLLVVGAVLFLAPEIAQAVGVKFAFTGVVAEVDAALAAEFSPGESLVGSYTFESTTPDSSPGDPVVGRYANAIIQFTATFDGDYTVTLGSDNEISIANGPPGNDVYQVFLTNPTAPPVGGLSLGALFFGLADRSSTGLGSKSLPLTPPSLPAFELDSSGAIYLSRPNQSVRFRLTSLTLVPEPSCCALAFLGLLGIGLDRKRYPE
jgi:hypothetical protein